MEAVSSRWRIGRGVVPAPDLDREDARRFEVPGLGQFLPSADLEVMDARKVHGRPGSAADLFDGLVMALQSADADRPAFGKQNQVVANRDAPGGDGPGDDRPMSGHGERAIDRQPEEAEVVAFRRGLAEGSEGLAERLATRPAWPQRSG